MTLADAAPGHAGSPDSAGLRIVVPRHGASVVGGAESAMGRLAHSLSSSGWPVQVWTTTAVDEATWTPGFAAGVEREGDVVVRRFPVVARRHPWLFRQLSHAVYHLPRHLRGEHLWSIAQGPYAPGLIRALAEAPAVATLFSPYLFHPTLFGLPAAPHPRILCPAAHDEPALRLEIVRRAVMSADALWFHSPEERDVLLAAHPGAERLPSQVGVVGVEAPGHVDDRAFALRHGISASYLYHGGRMTAGKGLELLLTGFALLRHLDPAVELVLSGETGDVRGAAGVREVGRLDERERWEAIAGAVAVVVPGTLESLSLLALESWAMGRPCLLNAASTVLAGHAARSAGGFTFTSAEELAARAHDLMANPQAAAAMGAAGQSYVARTYRWDLAEQRLRALIEATAS